MTVQLMLAATCQNSLSAPKYLSRCQLFLISSDIACSPRTLHKIDLSAPAGQGLVHKAPFDPSGHAAGGEPTFVARDAAALYRRLLASARKMMAGLLPTPLTSTLSSPSAWCVHSIVFECCVNVGRIRQLQHSTSKPSGL